MLSMFRIKLADRSVDDQNQFLKKDIVKCFEVVILNF